MVALSLRLEADSFDLSATRAMRGTRLPRIRLFILADGTRSELDPCGIELGALQVTGESAEPVRARTSLARQVNLNSYIRAQMS